MDIHDRNSDFNRSANNRTYYEYKSLDGDDFNNSGVYGNLYSSLGETSGQFNHSTNNFTDLGSNRIDESKIESSEDNLSGMVREIGHLSVSDLSRNESMNSIGMGVSIATGLLSSSSSSCSVKEAVIPMPLLFTDSHDSLRFNNSQYSVPLPLTDSQMTYTSQKTNNSFLERDRSNKNNIYNYNNNYNNNNKPLLNSNEINQKCNSLPKAGESERKLNIPETPEVDEKDDSFSERKIEEEKGKGKGKDGEIRRGSCYSLEESSYEYTEPSPEETFQYYETQEKVICIKEGKETSKLNCLKYKGKEEEKEEKYICVNCAKKLKCKLNEFEDWYNKESSMEEVEGKYKECTKCGHCKPLFLFLKRNKKSQELIIKKMCLFCRNKKMLENNNNNNNNNNKKISEVSTEKLKLEPYKKTDFLPPINKFKAIPDISSIIKPGSFPTIENNIMKEELELFLENSQLTIKCGCCNMISNVTEGLKHEDMFYCRYCLKKAIKDKMLRKIEFIDPIYDSCDMKEYPNLIICKRCSKYKRIASFMNSKGSNIQISTYCKCCSLKKNI